METIKNIAAIVGCVLSIISLITVFSKGARNFFIKIFSKGTQKIQEENQQQAQDIAEIKNTLNTVLDRFSSVDEVLMQQCRNTIKNIYYKYQKDKRIPLFERKTVDKTYEIYRNVFHGNSYIVLLYNEIIKWEIDTISYQDLDEDA